MNRFTSVSHNTLTPITYQIVRSRFSEVDSEHTRMGLHSYMDTIQLVIHSRMPFILCIPSQIMTKQLSTSHFLTIPYIHSFYLTLHNKTTAYHKYCGYLHVESLFQSCYYRQFTHCWVLARSHSHFIHSILPFTGKNSFLLCY